MDLRAGLGGQRGDGGGSDATVIRYAIGYPLITVSAGRAQGRAFTLTWQPSGTPLLGGNRPKRHQDQLLASTWFARSRTDTGLDPGPTAA